MNELERIALEALLAGEHPALTALRRQLEMAEIRARELTGCGQLTDFWVADEAQALDVAHRFAIDDVYGRLVGMEEDTAFLLHIVRGRVKTLESFVLGEDWPERPSLERHWYVAPDPRDPVELCPVDPRDLDHALRGLSAPVEDL